MPRQVGGGEAPALEARLEGVVDGVQLELATVVEHDGEVDEPVKPRFPRRDSAFWVNRHVRDH